MATKAKKRLRRAKRKADRMILANAPETSFAFAQAVELDIEAADDGGGPPSFAMHAYTGGRLNLRAFSLPVVVDLAGMIVGKKKKPILRDHDSSAIVGHSTGIEVKADGLHVEGIISASNDAAREVVESARNGFPWEASIGARPEKMVFVDDGEKITANGRTFTGPLYVARASRLGEISFVALGADEGGATATVAAQQGEHDMGFAEWCQSHGYVIEAMDDRAVAHLRSVYEAEIAAAADPDPAPEPNNDPAPDPDPENNDPAPEGDEINAAMLDLRTQAAAETRRIHAIGELCGNDHPELQARAIESNWSAERTELEIRRAAENAGIQAGLRYQQNNEGLAEEVEAQIIEASLLGSLGYNEQSLRDDFNFSDRVIEGALSSRYRGAGIATAMHFCCRRANRYVRSDRVDDDTIRATFEADQMLIRAAGGGGGFSTTGLSGILSNMANKLLMAGYQSIASVVPDIAAETDTSDFKEFTRFRLNGLNGVLEQIGRGGEIKHTQLDEQAFPNRLRTYANMLALTREMMIDDDLGAFGDIPRIFGRMAAMTREKVVFTMILAGVGGGFYQNTITDPLGIDGLTEGVKQFRAAKAPDGEPILVNPALLIVGGSNEVVAQQLNVDTRQIIGDRDTTATELSKLTDGNPHRGRYTPVVSPYLDVSGGLSGGSDTHWLLAARPQELDWIQVAYLRGARNPVLQTAQADFNTLGMQWRTYYDFGVAMTDYRGVVYSDGTLVSAAGGGGGGGKGGSPTQQTGGKK